MKFSVLISIARQVEGEYIHLRVIKANPSGDKLHRYLRDTNLPRAGKVGDMECVFEYGVFEDIEVEEN
jgi:hypothetical protein